MDVYISVINVGDKSLQKLYRLNEYLYELACEDEDAVIYDSVDTFFKELNYDLVDTENNLWFLV